MDNKLGVSGSAKIKVQIIEDNYSFKSLRFLTIEITRLLHDSIMMKGEDGEVSLEIDNSFDRVAHSVRTGTVVAIPEKLIVGNGRDKMPWRVPNEIEVGDLALFSYDPITRILNGTDPLFMWKDRYFILVPYYNVAMVKRNGKIIPVNGYVIMEPVSINDEDKLLGYHQKFLTPDAIGKFTSEKIGIIRYLSAPVEYYYGVPAAVDDMELEVGDVVLYRPKMDIPLEDDLHREFLPIKGLFKIQRRYMLAKLLK